MLKKKFNLVRLAAGSDIRLVCLVVISWQLILTILGIIIEQVMIPNMPKTVPEGVISHTLRWDSGWYYSITEEFYRSRPGQAAFYPLFPLLTYLLHNVSLNLISITTAGFLINITASCFASVALYKIGLHLFKDRRYAWTAVILFLAFPSAVFMHFFYTEALFCALGFWAYYYALKRRWGVMAILLALLSATRLTAILFIGLCGLEYLRSKQWKILKLDRNIGWFALSPAGFLLYGLYLQKVRGSFFAMFKAYHEVPDWRYQIFNPNIVQTMWQQAHASILIVFGSMPLDNLAFSNVFMPLAALGLLFFVGVIALTHVRSWGVPIGLFSLASFVLFTLNSNIVSVHRYVLPALGIYLVPLWFIRKRPQLLPYFWVGAGLMAMIQVLLLTLFVGWYFAG